MEDDMSDRIRSRSTCILAFMFVWMLSDVRAQSYPSQVIRIVVGTAPSTPPDIISRVIATEVAAAEGWRVVVENRPGAINTIAAAEVLKQPADGYSIFALSMPTTVAPALLSNMSFQLNNDLAAVVKISTSYNVLVVNPSLPASSVAELVALLKSKPDQLTFSSGGFGTPAHVVGELFKLETGTRATHVPYPQFPQAIADLLNGTNQFMFITTLPVIDLIATGKLRALAVTAPKRIAVLKEIPSIVEQGFPRLVVEDWVGFAVKSGTQPEITERLNKAFNQALAKSSVQDALAKLGADPAGGTASEFGKLVNSQTEYWAKVVREAGIKLPQ
jgi:tripartite-type tricarboxylate transporter receptor subunit TctC